MAQNGWFWQNPMPQANSIYTVQYIDVNNIIAGSGYGTLLKSSDSGENWEVLSNFDRSFTSGTGLSPEIKDVYFLKCITWMGCLRIKCF